MSEQLRKALQNMLDMHHSGRAVALDTASAAYVEATVDGAEKVLASVWGLKGDDNQKMHAPICNISCGMPAQGCSCSFTPPKPTTLADLKRFECVDGHMLARDDGAWILRDSAMRSTQVAQAVDAPQWLAHMPVRNVINYLNQSLANAKADGTVPCGVGAIKDCVRILTAAAGL